MDNKIHRKQKEKLDENVSLKRTDRKRTQKQKTKDMNTIKTNKSKCGISLKKLRQKWRRYNRKTQRQ